MISRVQQQDIDLWEVWIEYDQFNAKSFGTLYVLGEIMADYKIVQPAIKKSYSFKKQQLVLQIPERPSGRCRTHEVVYAEPIEDLNQYASITIFSGTELVATFTDIEVMI